MAEALGHNAFVLKTALGHTQISTTEIYCHTAAPAVVIASAKWLRGGKEGWKEESQPEQSVG